MGKRIFALIIALACAVVTATGCATQIAGVAQPVGASSATGGDGGGSAAATTSELGDPRTVDVCQFAPQDSFKALAPKFKLDQSLLTYGSCYLSLVLADDSTPPKVTGGYLLEARTETGLATPADYLKKLQVTVTAKQVNGRTVYGGSGQQDMGCVRGVTLSGGQAVLLSAKNSQSNPTADPCPIADAMAAGAIAVLKAGNFKHNPFPAGSAGDVDLCPTLSSIAAKALGGNVTATPEGFFGCDFVDKSHNIVSVLLSSDDWPPTFKIGTPQQFQVGARDGLITPISNAKLASTYVQVKYGDSPYRKGEFEVVMVNVTIVGKTDVTPQSRQAATDIVAALDDHR